MIRVPMRLSLQVHYAICGVFDLAYNGQGERVSIQMISQRQAIPTRYLEQIFQKLRKADLVTSKRGPGGGYELSRSAGEITLRQIVEAVEGSLSSAFQMAQGPGGGESVIHRPDFLWDTLAVQMAGALDSTTVEWMCVEAEKSEVPRSGGDGPMYFI
ncbi:Rrf2 family transcriptional regulator [Myxococcota bacterium]|nr:Rrf2 family transcriptional regulator [Myxococcota bacterium]